MIGADGFSGVKLKKWRLKRGMSQNKLAMAAGCSQASMIWRYETGHTTPTQKTLARLAEALDIEPEQLMKRGYQ